MSPLRRRTAACRHQSGATTVEFALIAIVFLTLLLGIMEFGRMMYVWNTAQEVTRRAAREAVVRNFATQVDAVRREAVFQPGSSGTAYLPAGVEISNVRVRITYLNASMNEADPQPSDPADNLSACGDATRVNSCIRYVRAEICEVADDICGAVPYVPMVGLLAALGIDLAVRIPLAAVVMPAESLGFAI